LKDVDVKVKNGKKEIIIEVEEVQEGK
jgi:hypothetical protein